MFSIWRDGRRLFLIIIACLIGTSGFKSYAVCPEALKIEIKADGCIEIKSVCVDKARLLFVLQDKFEEVGDDHAYISVAPDSKAEDLILVEGVLRRLDAEYTTKLGQAWVCDDIIVFDDWVR